MTRIARNGALVLVAAGLGGCYGSWDHGGYYGGYYDDYSYSRPTTGAHSAGVYPDGGVEELLFYSAVYGVVLVIWGIGEIIEACG